MIGGDKSNDDHDEYGHFRHLVVQSLHRCRLFQGWFPNRFAEGIVWAQLLVTANFGKNIV